MKKIQLTKEGFDNLQKELEGLKMKKRPVAVDRLQKARSMGDLKENGAYHAAREELSQLDGRIREVEYILHNAKVVTTCVSDLTVTLGKKIEVDINGLKKTISIVGEYESDPMNGKISVVSPIGLALLNKKPGEKVSVITPKGPVPYTILSIT